jgi:ribosomal protein S1
MKPTQDDPSDWEEAEKALSREEPILLEVEDQNRGGLLVRLGNLQGFVPNSLIPDLKRTKNRKKLRELKTNKIGQMILFKVIEVNRIRNRFILAALDEQSESLKKRLAQFELGQIVEGQVSEILDQGIMVEMDGVSGFVHISDLDWQWIDNPSDILHTGEILSLSVKGIDFDRLQVVLSRKVLLPNPWEIFSRRYKPGDLVQATVIDLDKGGLQLQIVPGIRDTICMDQLKWLHSDQLETMIEPGNKLIVRIEEFNPEQASIQTQMPWSQT